MFMIARRAFLVGVLGLGVFGAGVAAQGADPLKLLIIDGQNNHVLFDVEATDYNYFQGLTIRNTDIAFQAGTKYKGGADNEKSVDCDMRVGVRDAVKDRVMFQQELEPIHIHLYSEDEQKE